jgi:hypothetical protein
VGDDLDNITFASVSSHIMYLFSYSLLPFIHSFPSVPLEVSRYAQCQNSLLELRILQIINKVPWTGDRPMAKPMLSLMLDLKFLNRNISEYVMECEACTG